MAYIRKKLSRFGSWYIGLVQRRRFNGRSRHSTSGKGGVDARSRPQRDHPRSGDLHLEAQEACRLSPFSASENLPTSPAFHASVAHQTFRIDRKSTRLNSSH